MNRFVAGPASAALAENAIRKSSDKANQAMLAILAGDSLAGERPGDLMPGFVTELPEIPRSFQELGSERLG
jgi:hypothetical protein